MAAISKLIFWLLSVVRMIYTNLDNFYVSKESLENSPSRQDGVSAETESELRIYGTTLIQAGGCLLQLPQVVMATGQVLFHRFFCKESMAKFDVEVRENLKRCRWYTALKLGSQDVVIAHAESGLDFLLAGNKTGGNSPPDEGHSGSFLQITAQEEGASSGAVGLLLRGEFPSCCYNPFFRG